MTETEEKFKRFKRDLRATAKLCARAYRLSEENARLRKALENTPLLNIIFPLWTARFGKYSTTAMAWTNRNLERGLVRL